MNSTIFEPVSKAHEIEPPEPVLYIALSIYRTGSGGSISTAIIDPSYLIEYPYNFNKQTVIVIH